MRLQVCKINDVSRTLNELVMAKSVFRSSIFRYSVMATVFAGGLLLGQQVPMGPTFPVPQEGPKTPDKTQSPVVAPKSEGGAAVSADYKVGPADVLKINVWNEDKFSGMYTVDQDGRFVFPLVGDLTAGGLTTAEVKETVEKALSKYVVKPRVDVTVQEVQSKKYYLNGLVNHPGEYLLAVPTTILQAISKAGGLQDFANQKKIYVLRGSTKIPFNYKEVSQGKKMEQNILIQPGDQLFIP